MPDGAGLYSIGIVAKLTGLHEQTIRQYEKQGLVTPERSPGGTRIFAESDVELLRTIANLTREMGVNMAGVEIILDMRKRQTKLVKIAREMFNHLAPESRAHFEHLLRGDEPGLVPTGESGMATAKRKIIIEDGENHE